MQLLIPVYNNPTYLSNFLSQLKRFRDLDIIVIDGGSTFPVMIDLLNSIKNTLKVIFLKDNPGPHWFYENQKFYNQLNDFFLVSDPDLQFDTEIPIDFFNTFIEISERYCIGKVGSSIKLPEGKFKNELLRIGDSVQTIYQAEKQFWENELYADSINFRHFLSPIDTTLALYNKKWFDPYTFLNSIRVADVFEVVHLPWDESFIVPQDELLYYKKVSQHSYYSGAKSENGEPFRYISHRAYLELLNRAGNHPKKSIKRLGSLVRKLF